MRGSFTDHFNTAVLLLWLFQMLLFSVTDRDEQENGGSGKRVPQLTQTHTHTSAPKTTTLCGKQQQCAQARAEEEEWRALHTNTQPHAQANSLATTFSHWLTWPGNWNWHWCECVRNTYVYACVCISVWVCIAPPLRPHTQWHIIVVFVLCLYCVCLSGNALIIVIWVSFCFRCLCGCFSLQECVCEVSVCGL